MDHIHFTMGNLKITGRWMFIPEDGFTGFEVRPIRIVMMVIFSFTTFHNHSRLPLLLEPPIAWTTSESSKWKNSTKRCSWTWPLWWLLVESETRFFSVPCYHGTTQDKRRQLFPGFPNPCRWSRMSLGPLHCKANDTKEISWSKVSPLFLRPSAPLREFLHSLGPGASQIAWGLCNDQQLLSLHTALAVPKCPSCWSQLFPRLWNAAHAHGRHVLSTPVPLHGGCLFSSEVEAPARVPRMLPPTIQHGQSSRGDI